MSTRKVWNLFEEPKLVEILLNEKLEKEFDFTIIPLAVVAAGTSNSGNRATTAQLRCDHLSMLRLTL